jgi:hypothetical protein
MPVSENETAMSRGRVPSYLRRQMSQFMSSLLCRRRRFAEAQLVLLQRNGSFSSFQIAFFSQYNRRRQRQLLCDMMSMLYYHYISYDMVHRPVTLFQQQPVENPMEEFSCHCFYQLCGFWPDQFEEVSNNLLLIPERINCNRTRCSATKSLALFVLLRRWKKADGWDDVAHTVRRGRVWCIHIYRLIFSLLARHYRRVVQVLDYRRIIPLLAEWSDEMVINTGCTPDVIFFTDGKPWKTTRPGRGPTAQALVTAAGGDNVNMMQQAYYNGHYGFCGAKVQHVLQADGMCYSFTCPLRRHDASVLRSSSMMTMLSVLYINNDQARPVKTVTDKAYGRTRHFRPLHTSLELRLLNDNEREAAEEEDSKNKGPRMGVELSFNNIVRKFTHTDYFASHRLLQQGRSNWPYLRTLWDLQVLFYNLFTCAQGHGNPCNVMFGIAPPTVAEYLFSANNNRLIPMPVQDGEDDNFGVDDAPLYYNI